MESEYVQVYSIILLYQRLSYVFHSNSFYCLLVSVDDARLLLGIIYHGFGNWEKIRLDESLGLTKKIAPVELQHHETFLPRAPNLKERATALLEMVHTTTETFSLRVVLIIFLEELLDSTKITFHRNLLQQEGKTQMQKHPVNFPKRLKIILSINLKHLQETEEGKLVLLMYV